MSAKIHPADKRKAFNRILYDRYNQSGIDTACSFLKQQGYEIVNTLDNAFVLYDFIVSKDGREYKIEVEITEKWIGHNFPYAYMSVPYGKRDSIADFYIRTNPSGSALIFMPMREVLQAPVIRKDTCYTRNEAFFNLRVSSLPLYICEDGIWRRADV